MPAPAQTSPCCKTNRPVPLVNPISDDGVETSSATLDVHGGIVRGKTGTESEHVEVPIEDGRRRGVVGNIRGRVKRKPTAAWRRGVWVMHGRWRYKLGIGIARNVTGVVDVLAG